MKFGKIALAASAASFAIAPIAAQAADRSTAPVEGEAELRGNNSIALLVVFALAAIAIGIFVSDSDGPVSP